MLLMYNFNATRSEYKYKGTGAVNAEKNRLENHYQDE
jgi:hypothetical protein